MIPLFSLLLLAALALALGVVGSLAGLVLGNLRLPALLALLPPAVAAGTNITISGAGAGAGAITHLRAGRFDRPAFLIMAPPSVVGAILGGFLSADVPGSLLVLLVAVIVLEQGAELVRSGTQATPLGPPRPPVGRDARWGLLMASTGF
ncbi:MAG: TSUP family transporter, partial [Thermoplasmata archaeon]|nr:TSUP family transporter [Thermoplasmata archaeon]